MQAGGRPHTLFGIVGAHFLLRTLRLHKAVSKHDRDDLERVIDGLGRMLGARAPDIVALRAAQTTLLGKELPAAPDGVPMYRAGMNALIEATATRPDWLKELEDVALTMEPGSRWTCWRRAPFVRHPAFRAGDIVTHRLSAAGEKALVGLEVLLQRDGLDPVREWHVGEGEVLMFKMAAAPDGSLDRPARYRRLAKTPDRLVNLVADQLDHSIHDQSKADFFVGLTLRSGLPCRLLKDAAHIADLAPSVLRERPSEMAGAPA